MNDKEISMYLGFKGNYLSVLKCTNREKYDYIFSFDKNKLNSINKYNIYVSDLLEKVTYIYYTYEVPHHFAIWLQGKGFYTHSCVQAIEKVLFKNYEHHLKSWLSVIDKLENIILKYYTGD